MAAIHEITEDWQNNGPLPTWGRLQQARAEFDALAADAARYRWLTEDHPRQETRMKVYEVSMNLNVRGKGHIDAAIDAAMKGE